MNSEDLKTSTESQLSDIQKDIDSLSFWLQVTGLDIHPKAFKLISFGQHTNAELNFNGSVFQHRVSIIICENLTRDKKNQWVYCKNVKSFKFFETEYSRRPDNGILQTQI